MPNVSKTMLAYMQLDSLCGLDIIHIDYDKLVRYLEWEDDAELITLLPDGYVNSPDIYWKYAEQIHLLPTLVKKMNRELLNSIFEDVQANPLDDVEEHYDVIITLATELKDDLRDDDDDYNLAQLLDKKLSDYDDFTSLVPECILLYFLSDDVYEPDQLANLIKLASANSLDSDICNQILMKLQEQPHIMNDIVEEDEERNTVNELVFRCIQTNTELVYNSSFEYLLGLMEQDLTYYLLSYGMKKLTAKDILEQADDFAHEVNIWQKTDIAKSKVFIQLVKEIIAIDSNFAHEVRKNGITYQVDSHFDDLFE